MTSLTCEKLTKAFGAYVAVDELQLDIPDGEFLVIVGPSGCGKSTALRCIAGLEEITSGRLLIGGEDVTHVPPMSRDIAMVFQSYALYPHMDVRANLAFGLRHRKVPKPIIEKKIEEVARSLELTSMLDRRPRELSGGQRQRVALGRAIVREPRIFLMDEPLSNLDAKLRVQTRAELVSLQKALGITTIYVTHDQIEAMTMGHRIAIMDAGKLQQMATPQEIYDRPANRFVASFIGSPAMNIIRMRLDRDGDRIKGNQFEMAFEGSRKSTLERHVGEEIDLGVRPESIFLGGEKGNPIGGELYVSLVEPLGPEKLVHLTATDGTVIITKVPTPTSVIVGDKPPVRIDYDLVHVFDADSGMALSPYE